MGSVQHRRNRIVKTSLHFGRFSRAVCHHPQIHAAASRSNSKGTAVADAAEGTAGARVSNSPAELREDEQSVSNEAKSHSPSPSPHLSAFNVYKPPPSPSREAFQQAAKVRLSRKSCPRFGSKQCCQFLGRMFTQLRRMGSQSKVS